jgi:hypothetical protein
MYIAGGPKHATRPWEPTRKSPIGGPLRPRGIWCHTTRSSTSPIEISTGGLNVIGGSGSGQNPFVALVSGCSFIGGSCVPVVSSGPCVYVV